MGMIKCPIHGNQGLYEVCEHIWEDLENGIIPTMKDFPVLDTKVCESCFESNNLSKFEQLTFDDILELSEEEQNKLEVTIVAKYDNIKSRIKCVECFNKIRFIDAKRGGKELPFEPYENTLMHQDKEKIDTLREVLTSNYSFQKSRIHLFPFLDAFHIISGGISYSFSITFYYITEKEDQDKLLKLINDFFEDIPQKQRVIRFFEAENWIIEKRGNSSSEHRGEEKLIREEIVK